MANYQVKQKMTTSRFASRHFISLYFSQEPSKRSRCTEQLIQPGTSLCLR